MFTRRHICDELQHFLTARYRIAIPDDARVGSIHVFQRLSVIVPRSIDGSHECFGGRVGRLPVCIYRAKSAALFGDEIIEPSRQ